jgi:hypothetical protein
MILELPAQSYCERGPLRKQRPLAESLEKATPPGFTVEEVTSLVESAEFNKHIFPCMETWS